MTLSKSQTAAYQLFALALLLWLASIGAALLAAIKWAGTDPLATSLLFHHANSLAGLLANLTVLTGLLGGGLYIAAANGSNEAKNAGALKLAAKVWIALAVITIAAGLLHIGGGWNEIAISPLMSAAALVMLVIFVGLLLAERPDPAAALVIIGVVFAALGLLLDLLPSGDMQLAMMQNVLGQGSINFIGYPLAGIGLAFWLARRYSNVPLEWAQQGAFSCGALAILAGICMIAARLAAVVDSSMVNIASAAGIVLVPFAYIVTAAHVYRTLSVRNGTAALAGHWVALAALCWLIGAALGAIIAIPDVMLYAAGTQLAHAQISLFGLGILATILGAINQNSAELRGKNARVTGLMPFWMVAFGGIGAALMQAAAGVAQVFMARVSGFGFLDTEAAIAPLYLLWALCLLVVAIGALAYLAGFWARRPYEHVEIIGGAAGATNA